jgi:4-hydroxybenzoate polyprenyltransferase
MVDRDDDLKAGARSTAILLGDLDRFGVAVLHGSFLVALFLLGQRAELDWPWLIALGVALILIGWQLWLAREQQRDACFRAFALNNYVGATVFLGLAVHYLLPQG